MKIIKHFFEFSFIIIIFIIFKIIGYKNATNFGEIIIKKLGPYFRSNYKIQKNLENSEIGNSEKERKIIINNMWGNYGRIFAEYMYIKKYRQNSLSNNINVVGQNILDEIKNSNEPVIFISGHFNNFELMAMHLEKSGIDLAAIYRPLNNKFLNPLMEKIRKNYICKKQIKKGMSGTKEILKYFKKGTSIALMIDQRVSEGISCNFFNRKALTTTIPAQFVKKFNCKVVPIYIERKNKNQFRLEILNPIKFFKNENIEIITSNLNKVLEKMIKRNPDQWIWTHDRWK
ncbi:lysophospholipid acyltransferase family protein [Pelagibacterales bacterium SAG-MED30]|nr:lysophospholipid acyltransferase family protein [Pelagibacterales bacterium SAG-MED30]|tara:strand:+ start:15 stop:875 length:861 start_codon:yes stop_codon:yes gene_type:complete